MRFAVAASLALLALIFAHAGFVAHAEEPRSPDLPAGQVRPPDPLPFNHDVHARAFASLGVVCTDCHAVGQALGTTSHLGETCHACHLQQVPGAPRSAPRACETCHADRSELRPLSHDAAWMVTHGGEARASGASCKDCHAVSACLDCHDRRGAMSTSPHPPGFRAVHGLEARVDPASCGSCHANASCVACHAGGGIVP